MIKITSILLESLRLIESTIGERIFDSLSMLYDTQRGGGSFIQELKSLDKQQLDSVLAFLTSVGFDVPANSTPQAIHRTIVDAITASPSSSQVRNEFAMGGDDDEDEDEPEFVVKDEKLGITVRQPRMRDDPAAAERHLAGQLGYRGRSENDEE